MAAESRPVNMAEDIPVQWQGTAIADLLEFQNLERPHTTHQRPRCLVATCMDHRIALRLPERFAYVVRVAGALLQEVEDSVAVAVALGGIEAIAVITHTDCAMVRLATHSGDLVDGLVQRSDWSAEDAAELAERASASTRGLGPADLAWAEAERLRATYPNLPVAPLVYDVTDDRLYVI